MPRRAEVVVGLLSILVAGACVGSAPPPPAVPAAVPTTISDVHYALTFDSSTARARTVRVSMSFDVSGTGPVLLSLPAWTPGAYEISNFARWLTDFSASAGGTPLAWDKADHDTWRVAAPGGQRATVAFTYAADTLDNAMAWSTDDFLMVNGTTVFMYPDGQTLDYPARLTVTTQAGWRVATGMTAVGPHEFRSHSFHELVDMPLFIGHFDVDTRSIAGHPVTLATYPAESVSEAARENVLDAIGRMLPPLQAVFDTTPFRDFTILQVIDPGHSGISALEHANSFVAITTPEALGTAPFHSIFAHEFFHVWNIEAIRPAALRPYRYDRPQPTEWLWVSEGITDYYADLALVRGGLVDTAGFLSATVAKIVEVDTMPAVSLEDASLSTWLRPTDGTHYAYYTKGSLAGLLLDILIRDASDNRGSLDVVMKELYAMSTRENRGFTGDDWWGTVSSAAGGRSFDDVRRRYIEGREPFPWEAILPLAGLRLLGDTIREPVVGILVRQDTAGLVVAEVEPRSAAAVAGIRVGDRLASFGGIPVDAPDFAERLRVAFGSGEASELPVGLRRGGRRLTITVPVTYVPVIEYSIVPDSAADERALRIRAGLLHGSLDR